jgi:hypothetical protein
VDQSEVVELGRCCNQQVDRAGAPMLSTAGEFQLDLKCPAEHAVVRRDPSEHALEDGDDRMPVVQRPGTEEVFELNGVAECDEPGLCGSVPAVHLAVASQQLRQRARVDEVAGGIHRR